MDATLGTGLWERPGMRLFRLVSAIDAEQWHGLDQPRAGTAWPRVWAFKDIHPSVPQDTACATCALPTGQHGWIGPSGGGHKLCPKGWIIVDIELDAPYVVSTTAELRARYERAQEPRKGFWRKMACWVTDCNWMPSQVEGEEEDAVWMASWRLECRNCGRARGESWRGRSTRRRKDRQKVTPRG